MRMAALTEMPDIRGNIPTLRRDAARLSITAPDMTANRPSHFSYQQDARPSISGAVRHDNTHLGARRMRSAHKAGQDPRRRRPGDDFLTVSAPRSRRRRSPTAASSTPSIATTPDLLSRFRCLLAVPLFVLLCVPAPAAALIDPKQDDKTATELRQQANKGNGDAALQLGNLLARNRVPVAKYGNAVDWYKKSCALNNLSACHNAGVSYEHGRNGVKINNTEAANYYLKSAERAFLPSLLNLAILHADGRVSSLDHRDGLKWMLVAQQAAAQCPNTPMCKLVLEDPKGYRARLEAPLSADERREARQMAERWRPVH
jgi:hypothetical protein